jgi:ribosomal protein S18 acetylase RimI-like enzyme
MYLKSDRVNIRKARYTDISQLEILFQLTNRSTFVSRPKDDFQIGDYQKSTAEDDVWVAEKDEIIVGFVSTYPAENFVHNLFVHPDYQTQGIGTQLLHIAEANLGRPMTLKIAMDNLKACGFYEKYNWYKASQYDDIDKPYLLYKKD